MEKRVIYFDVLRAISIMAVIIIHISGNTINTLGLEGIDAKIYNSIAQIMYFAVPIFIMLSGALFLNPKKEITLKKLFSKNIIKILVGIFVFGFLYSMIELFFETKSFSVNMVIESVKNIITGNLWAHMWYLYIILGLYMLVPLLKKFTANCTKSEYQYILGILFIFTILLNPILEFFKITTSFSVIITNPYIFLFLLGDYLARFEIKKYVRYIIYVLSIISIFIIIANNLEIISLYNWLSYTSILVTVNVISLFLIFKNGLKNNKLKYEKILKSISECGFGIYIIHQFFINILYKFLKIDIILKSPYLGLIMYVFGVFFISYIVVYVLRKISIIKKYIL